MTGELIINDTFGLVSQGASQGAAGTFNWLLGSSGDQAALGIGLLILVCLFFWFVSTHKPKGAWV